MELLEKVLKKRSDADRKKDAKKKAKWAKTAGGKKSALKSKKRADKVKSGSVRVDKARSKAAKKTAKLYNGYSFKEFNEEKMTKIRGKLGKHLQDKGRKSRKDSLTPSIGVAKSASGYDIVVRTRVKDGTILVDKIPME